MNVRGEIIVFDKKIAVVTSANQYCMIVHSKIYPIYEFLSVQYFTFIINRVFVNKIKRKSIFNIIYNKRIFHDIIKCRNSLKYNFISSICNNDDDDMNVEINLNDKKFK